MPSPENAVLSAIVKKSYKPKVPKFLCKIRLLNFFTLESPANPTMLAGLTVGIFYDINNNIRLWFKETLITGQFARMAYSLLVVSQVPMGAREGKRR